MNISTLSDFKRSDIFGNSYRYRNGGFEPEDELSDEQILDEKSRWEEFINHK